MDNQSGAELRLKPGSLGRHDVTCIGYIHKLFHGYGIERNDPDKVKSIKDALGYIAINWFEELDQFNGEAELRKVLQSTTSPSMLNTASETRSFGILGHSTHQLAD